MEKKTILRVATILGIFSSLAAITVWVILIYFNPYTSLRAENDVIIRTFLTIVAPAIVALVGLLLKKTWLMVITFIWSLPVSLYLALTPGIFKYFGVVSIGYLLSAFFMYKGRVPK